MTVFANSRAGYFAGKQVVPMDYQAEVSQRLVDAAHGDDTRTVYECMIDPFVDVNFVGTVSLRSKRTEIVPRDECPHEVAVEYEEFKTEVTALFLAAQAGNLTLVRKLLSMGADVNQKLFRGYAITAAVREGHIKIAEVLMTAGASRDACEEALVEASYVGEPRISEMLMGSQMIRPHVAVRALVLACCRGFVEVVDALIKCGVDVNGTDRALLQSSKPSLHINVDCNPLIAAIISRQVLVVRRLLQADVRVDIEVRLGAWSWDENTGEEFRVGAGLAEPYSMTWCAVEYFECTGAILRMLFRHLPSSSHHGRTLLHHAILCNNSKALDVLLKCGADSECPLETTPKTGIRSVHLAARLGYTKVLQDLISAGCDLHSRTECGETALMIAARCRHEECVKVLASAGADIAWVSSAGQSAESIAESVKWTLGFQQAVVDVIRAGKVPQSSNAKIFCPLMFVTQANDVEALKKLIEHANINLDEQDADGYTPAMRAAANGHMEAFTALVYAGANTKLKNKQGDTVRSLSELTRNGDTFDAIMQEYEFEKRLTDSARFNSLHQAALDGLIDLVHVLMSKGHDVNAPDVDGYTPLMLAAKGGHSALCELLISHGARCGLENAKHETALTLSRQNGIGSNVERVILDELARKLVLEGARVKKHTKCGRGTPHVKLLKMVRAAAVLRWGKSSKRNVICKRAEVGPSSSFRWNRRRKFDTDEPGMFHVVTTKNKEIHFVCEGGNEMARLWVRGIKLVTREGFFGKIERRA
ncbi:ANK_REP_REGION domain-containing protein [Psidium guajava]|nr:ANK_REP_REGION domain-containing protein [Psidium guajava]